MKKQKKLIGTIIVLMFILLGCKKSEEVNIIDDNSIIGDLTDSLVVNDMSGENRISEEEATSKVVAIIDKGYYINYVGEIQLNGEPYYEFTVLYSDEVIGPSIVVHQYSGLLHTIGYDNVLNDIKEHPLVIIENE